MPKEGSSSITVSQNFVERVSNHVNGSGGLVNSVPQALSQAWSDYEQRNLRVAQPKPVKIGNKLIGHDQPVFVIAEIGINHNGDMNITKKMIDLSVEKGCDAVKFQKRTLDVVFTPEFMDGPRNTPWGKTNRDEREKLEFSEEEYREIDRYCKEKGIMWFASPWDEGSVDFLEKFNTPCYKIASASLTDKNLLYKIKETGKPIILSIGMSNMEQVVSAIKILGQENLVLLHCTSTYPSRDHELDLNVLTSLRKHFDCPIGFSCHAPGIWPTIVATTLGACVLEKHITLDRSMFGWDHAASIEPKALGDMCRVSKRVPVMLGSFNKKIHDSEKPISDDLRRVDTL
jgi:N-acetylneuraminate synthase